MSILNILGLVIGAFIGVTLFVATFSIIQYLHTFHHRKCKHCGKVMEFKGLKEDNKEGHFLFHCNECGAWESVPKQDMFRSYDKETSAA